MTDDRPDDPAAASPAEAGQADDARRVGDGDAERPAAAAAQRGAANDAERPVAERPAAGGAESAEDDADGGAAVSGGAEGPKAPVSGLRNPAGALRGAGAGVLAIEALVLLLAVLPLRMLKAPGWGMAAVAILAALCLVQIGLLKRRWAWYAGIVLQALVVATGLAHWAIAVIGCIFAAIWLYVLHVRRTILGRI